MERKCAVCGEQVNAGMTDGDYYIHEECFEQYMDDLYGKHNWMQVNDDGCDGYYIVREDNVVGGVIGTGLYYTEWEEE